MSARPPDRSLASGAGGGRVAPEAGHGIGRGAGVVLVALLTLGAGLACVRIPVTLPGHSAPLPAALVYPVPEAITDAADTVTEMEMHNVDMHVDDNIRLHVHHLRGTARDLDGKHLIVLDDKKRLLFRIAYAEIALTTSDLSDLLNRYVFGYAGSPLRGLVVTADGTGIRQTGVLHKGVDIPFDMKATVTVTPEGLVRLHPTSMKICSIPGLGLLNALHLKLENMMDVSKAVGVQVKGNDLLLDPVRILPPPRIEGRLTAIRIQDGQLVQTFGTADADGARALAPPVTAPNYVFFHGGTLRFGKLYMVHTALEAIDQDPSTPFDFYLDYYATQLVAGYHKTAPDGALMAWMPDFDKLPSATTPVAAQGDRAR